ncbi:hypothetical protein [Serratia aquatilis]|uniref:Uncharacterized protein n=1 Tax=Serratia aquatilis TaxID=1737515 RepID=A0ABV6EHG4_9GAMM
MDGLRQISSGKLFQNRVLPFMPLRAKVLMESASNKSWPAQPIGKIASKVSPGIELQRLGMPAKHRPMVHSVSNWGYMPEPQKFPSQETLNVTAGLEGA